MMKPVGKKVLIKKYHESCINRKYGNIIIPTTPEDANMRLTKGEIISIGPEALNRCIEVGDVVLYDTMSVFDNDTDEVITNIENVIIKIEE